MTGPQIIAYVAIASRALDIFKLFFYKLGLQQFVRSPTINNNILDLILSNDFNCVYNVDIAQPFNNSDHNSVSFDILYNVNCTTTSQTGHYSPNFARLTGMGCDLTFQKSIIIDYFLSIKMLNLCLIIFTRFFTLLLISLFLINVPLRIPNVTACDTQLVSESYSAKRLLRGASTAPRKRLNLVFIITL